VDHLAPPPDLPANAREIFRLWSVKDDVRALRHASEWPDWDAYKLGEALSAVAADFVHARERKHLDPWQLKEDSDNLRLGLTNGLSRAHVTHDPFSGKALPSALRDEWFATVEKLLGRPYAGSLETPVPVEFDTEAWWIERGL
jgi:hypothetical protein